MEHTAVIVTGASRGFGRAIGVAMARHWRCRLTLVLAARSSELLQKTAQLVLAERAKVVPQLQMRLHESISVSVAAVDLSDLEATEAWVNSCVDTLSALRPQRVILVNNAGTIGALGCVQEIVSVATLRAEMDLNVTSALYITSAFTRRFGASRADHPDAKGHEPSAPDAVVINVSSLAARVPFQSWGMYCAGKAARDMFHAALAKEQEHCPSFRVLNYAPGPMDTDMQAQIRNSQGTFEPLRKASSMAYSDGALVSTEDSADKLLGLIDRGDYVSGSHVDFFDDLPGDGLGEANDGAEVSDDEEKISHQGTPPKVRG